MSQSACPKCGGATGYDCTLRVYGTVTDWCAWGEGRQERVNAEDGLYYVEPKTVRCIDCRARIPNPNYAA